MQAFIILRTDFASFLDGFPAVDREIESSRNRIRQLAAFRNTLTSVSKLPVELLRKIFLQLAQASFDHVYSDSPRRKMTPGGQRWLSVTWVCRHWRQVALSFPDLWTRFSMSHLRGDNLEASLQTFLSRSGSSPLTIACAHLNWEILRHRHRIQHLHGLSLPLNSKEYLERWVDPFNMPLLESMDLYRGGGLHGSVLKRAKFPKLQRLHCVAIPGPVVAFLTRRTARSLVCLVVDYSDDSDEIDAHKHRYTVTQWVDLLENLQQLQELRISQLLFPDNIISSTFTHSHIPSRQIQLPSLMRIAIVGYSIEYRQYKHGAAQLLAHLVCPPSASINVNWSWSTSPFYHDIAEPVEEFSFILRCISQWKTATITPGSSTVDSRSVRLRTAKLSAHVGPGDRYYSQNDQYMHITLKACADDGREVMSLKFSVTHRLSHSRNLTDEGLLSPFTSSPLLSTVSDLSLNSIGRTAAVWSHLASSDSSLANVVDLRLETSNALNAFLEALERSHSSDGAAQFLPHLRSLAITTAERTPQVTEAESDAQQALHDEQPEELLRRLLDALAERRKQGLGPAFVDTGSGMQDVDQALRTRS